MYLYSKRKWDSENRWSLYRVTNDGLENVEFGSDKPWMEYKGWNEQREKQLITWDELIEKYFDDSSDGTAAQGQYNVLYDFDILTKDEAFLKLI